MKTILKFPIQQIGVETSYQKLNRRKPQKQQKGNKQIIQITNNNRLFQRRDITQIMGELLDIAMDSYKGFITTNSTTIRKTFGGYVHYLSVIQHAFSLNLVREATEQEKLELAKHRVIEESSGGSPFYGSGYKPHPSKASINKYIRMHLKRVYIITEKGRKLGEILRAMKGLLLLVN